MVRATAHSQTIAVSQFVGQYHWMSDWDKLESAWQEVMRCSIGAYMKASIPIGAVVVDERGEIVSRGRNEFTLDRIAHAETEALRAVPANLNRKRATLFSSLEPCPMCTGAIRLMQLGALKFAARDPAAGSTALLDASRFMRGFECRVFEPCDAILERVNVAMIMEYRTRNGHARWREEWLAYLPEAVEVGEGLAKAKAFEHWQTLRPTPKETYNTIASMLR